MHRVIHGACAAAAIIALAGCSSQIRSTAQPPSASPSKAVTADQGKTVAHCYVNVATPDDYRAQVIATGSDCRYVLSVVRRDIASYNAAYQMGLAAHVGRVPWDSAGNAICRGSVAGQAGIVVNPGQDMTHYYARPVCDALNFGPAQ